MNISIDVSGISDLSKALSSMAEEIQEAAEKATLATALEIRGEIIKRIQQGPASGVTYEKYNPRRTHTASAPGQAPMSDTGRLAGSVYFEAEGRFTASVGSRLAYAAYLEYGTREMPERRPVWEPVALEARDKYRKRIEAAIKGATK